MPISPIPEPNDDEVTLEARRAGTSVGINAASYGAVGDDVADDTDALQAAIDSASGGDFLFGTNTFGPGVRANDIGNTVYLPTGTYSVRGLTMGHQVRLCGAGNGTILKLRSGSNANLITSTNKAGWKIHDLTLDGNGAQNTIGHGLYVTGQTYGYLATVFKNVKIQSCAEDGIRLSVGGAGMQFSGVFITGCRMWGVNIITGNDSVWSDFDVSFCQEGGLTSGEVANHNMTNWKVWGCRVDPTTWTVSKAVPVAATGALDHPAVQFCGYGWRVSNFEVQENGSHGVGIGTATAQCRDSSFRGLHVDGNGGRDTGESAPVQEAYKRDGLQMVNYCNVFVEGMATDFRARQNKGRQKRGIINLGSRVEFTAGGFYPGTWLEIADAGGGADFTNIGAPNNTVGTVFFTHGTNFELQVPTSWGSTGKLYAANRNATVIFTVCEQTDQVDGIGTGYVFDPTTSGHSSFIINGAFLGLALEPVASSLSSAVDGNMFYRGAPFLKLRHGGNSHVIGTDQPDVGLLFDGGFAGTYVWGAFQDLATSPCTWHIRVRMPTARPTGLGKGLFSTTVNTSGSVSVNGCGLMHETTGELKFWLYGVTGSDYRIARVSPSIIDLYLGAVVDFVVTRSGTTLLIYANGSLLTQLGDTTAGSTVPAWSHSFTSTQWHVGTFLATNLWKGCVMAFRVANRALSAAEVFERNSLKSDQWGSQTVLASGALVIGARYRIVSRTDGDFVAAGAAANTVGTEFVATTAAAILDAGDTVVRIGWMVDVRFSAGTVADRSSNAFNGTVVGAGTSWT